MKTAQKRKILLVLYQFPPSGDVGALRWSKFVRYLADFGYHSFIIAPSNGIYNSYDLSLCSSSTDYCTVYRSPLYFPYKPQRGRNKTKWTSKSNSLWRAWNRLAVPDGAISWVPTAMSLGCRIVRENGISLIVASGQPFSTFMIGGAIKKRTGFPLILDYRDPWSLNPFYRGSNLRLTFEKKTERSLLRISDGLIFVTDELFSLYEERFPGLVTASNSYVVTNSLDDSLDIASYSQQNICSNHFYIVYAGNLYGARDPKPFLKGVKLAAAMNSGFRKKVRVLFYGVFDRKRLQEIVRELNLATLIRLHDRVSRPKIFSVLQRAAVLLIINSYGVGHEVFIPAKFFDYLAVRKPIFCVSQPGALSRVIQATGSGIVVGPENPDLIASELLRLFDTVYTHKQEFLVDKTNIDEYKASHVTKKLVRAFEDTLLRTQKKRR